MAPDSSYRAGDVEVREEIDFSGVLDGVLTPDSRDNRFTAHSYLCVESLKVPAIFLHCSPDMTSPVIV